MGELGNFFRGNRLNGSSSSQQPEPLSTPAKRPNDSSPPTQPHKRARHDIGARNTDPIQLDGSSDVRESVTPSLDSSSHRNQRPNGSLSQRSNAGLSAKGPGIDELRDTQKHASGGKSGGRRRHKKTDQGQASNGVLDWKRGSAGPGSTGPRPPIKPAVLISQQRGKTTPEVIEDSDEERRVYSQAGSRTTRPKKTPGYTAATFQPPISDLLSEDVSEDELGVEEPQPRLKVRDAMTAPSKSMKRRAQGSPDELHGESSAKRRPAYASEADIPRTTFSTTPEMGRAKGRDPLRVSAAVCQPGLIYPASDFMPAGVKGACDKSCSLLMKEDGPRGFMATSDLVHSLAELEWVVPNGSSISMLWHARDSAIVKIHKNHDFRADVASGKALFIRFATEMEAWDFVSWLKQRFSIKCQNLARYALQVCILHVKLC